MAGQSDVGAGSFCRCASSEIHLVSPHEAYLHQHTSSLSGLPNRPRWIPQAAREKMFLTNDGMAVPKEAALTLVPYSLPFASQVWQEQGGMESVKILSAQFALSFFSRLLLPAHLCCPDWSKLRAVIAYSPFPPSSHGPSSIFVLSHRNKQPSSFTSYLVPFRAVL